MDSGAIIEVNIGLFFGGVAFAYGGYSLKADLPFLTVFSYFARGGLSSQRHGVPDYRISVADPSFEETGRRR
jgi:hypothetical protein